jgi:hypothetical protein
METVYFILLFRRDIPCLVGQDFSCNWCQKVTLNGIQWAGCGVKDILYKKKDDISVRL